MKRIVLLRHGESLWNQENRFTGWTDVDLSEKGVVEACKAGDTLREAGFSFEIAYTSYLKRAIKTLDYVLDRLNESWIPVEKTWRLNEKHYGILQGLNKSETAAQYGEEQVHTWRRSYDIAPAALGEDDSRNPSKDIRYADVPGSYPINAASTVCRPTGTCGILKRPRLSVIVPAPSFSDSFTVAYGIGNFESPSITIPRMVCIGRPFRPVVWLNTVTDTNKAVNNRIHPP